MDIRRIIRGPVVWIVLAIMLVVLASSLLTNVGGPKDVDTSQVVTAIQSGNVTSATIVGGSDQRIEITQSNGDKLRAQYIEGQGVELQNMLQEQVKAGTMRLLAVSSAERLPGIEAPTIKESGFDVVVENWRMVAAAPGLSDEQKAKISAAIEKLNASTGWTKMLADKGWTNTYLAGDAFATQLDADIAATEGVLRDIGLVK